MNNRIRLTAAIISTLLFFSCQPLNAPDKNNGLNGDPDVQPKEYTLSFDLNYPANTEEYIFCDVTVNVPPASITKKEGTQVTVPGCSTGMTRYPTNSYGENGIVYVFDTWNTSADGTGVTVEAGSGYTISKNETLYAFYKQQEGTPDSDDNPALDFSIVSTYAMKMGDSVNLVSEIETSSVYYEIQSGSDVVELGSSKLTAIGPGTAIVRAIDWEDSSKSWSCAVTVTVEGFSGSALDYKLVGRWEDGNSYLVFNADKTGELKVYQNGSVIQESTFHWTTMENSYGKYLTLSSCSESFLEGKQYTITRISATSMSLHGYLAFGSAQDTSWGKR